MYGDQDYISIVARSLIFEKLKKMATLAEFILLLNGNKDPQSLIQRSSTPQPNSFDFFLASFYPDSSQLKTVFEFIEANYSQPITLNDVARAVGYSPAHLNQFELKRRTDKTIIHWYCGTKNARSPIPC
ncbi:MAG UNVERIFIED_CONTAM: hypothetical protein LVR29_23315 [Microcystis novacekii LVE1205-3]|jgi:hypothetical protein